MIPIYRAKKIDSDEYVGGFLVKHYCFYAILPYDSEMISVSTDFEFSFEDIGEDFIQIDPSTLSIHFTDMIDSEGTKIFASLSENGKGGDIIKGDFTTKNFTFTMSEYCLYKSNFNVCKVTGIQNDS